MHRLLEEMAAQQQKLLSEFEAALGRNQTTWSDQAKNLAQKSLNGALRAARDNTALLRRGGRAEQRCGRAQRYRRESNGSICAILAHVLH